MHICTECGSISEEDSDFCFKCGSTKGTNVIKELIPPQFEVVQTNKGAVLANTQFMKRVPLALMLGLIPGLFNIFGLGHVVVKKYLRAVVYLAISAAYFIIRFAYTAEFYIPYESWFGWITLAVFVVQAFDLYRCIGRGAFRP